MIVRIMGEGQVRLADSHFTELNKLDDELLAEMESGDGAGFRRTLGALLDAVRELGEPLPDDSLEPSELILPSPDATLEEVREMLERRRPDPGLSPCPARPRDARPRRRTEAGQARDVQVGPGVRDPPCGGTPYRWHDVSTLDRGPGLAPSRRTAGCRHPGAGRGPGRRRPRSAWSPARSSDPHARARRQLGPAHPRAPQPGADGPRARPPSSSAAEPP